MQLVQLENGNMFNAKTIENFILKEDTEYLVNLANSTDLWEIIENSFWNNRTIDFNKILKHDKNAAVIMLDAKIRCGQKIKEFYDLEEVYADSLHLIRWFPEMEQLPHADDMTNTEVKGLEHRAFGSIIYLNNNYFGGHTYYPNFDVEITPKPGMLAIHPGDVEHLHGVTKIEGAMRYTIASFWTLDKGKSHEWSIY